MLFPSIGFKNSKFKMLNAKLIANYIFLIPHFAFRIPHYLCDGTLPKNCLYFLVKYAGSENPTLYATSATEIRSVVNNECAMFKR